MARSYSVFVELEGGGSEVRCVSAETAGEAFRLAKESPGVRRVGRVAEAGAAGRADPAAPPKDGGRRGTVAVAARGREAGDAVRNQAGDRKSDRDADPAASRYVGSGPRVVVQARPQGGEQPFKHLQAPPERPKPPEPQRAAAPPPPPPAAAPAAATEGAAPAQGAAAAAAEYRVLKSRRRDGGGLPYVLQRGRWRAGGGKRVFEVAWEKSFASRGEAEAHQQWLLSVGEEFAAGERDGQDPQAA